VLNRPDPAGAREKLKLMIACSGLGRVRRGFESFADECFDAFRGSDRVLPALLHGPGEVTRANEFAAPLISQHQPLGRAYGWLRARGQEGRRQYEAFSLEQYTFGLSVARHARQQGTDVILFSEAQLGVILLKLRHWLGLRYRTIFSNGGPIPPPFPFCDHVQQLTPFYLDVARNLGVSAEMQSLVPYGFAMPVGARTDKGTLRYELNLPLDRRIVISVAAINRSHKRIDYLINEVAALGPKRPYVLFLGQIDGESAPIQELAAAALGEGNYHFASVPNTKIGPYYQASDLFVLTSLREGLARVLVEAMSHGLPCLVHDYPITRFALGEWGLYSDFAKSGGLASLLRDSLDNLANLEKLAERRQAAVRERFSWEHLLPAYEQMLYTAAGKPLV
jgi:1,2-diacylglycerol 3-alpha-glucosyltransferase